MLKLKYQNEKNIYDVNFQKITENVVQLTGDFPVETTGFELSRDNKDGAWDGWNYSDYTTIYRQIDGGVQFSNDESVYVELFESDFVSDEFMTEEMSETEKKKMELQQEIDMLKKQLSESDYKVIKNVEAESVGELYPYDAHELHAERQALRDKINELEEELSLL